MKIIDLYNKIANGEEVPKKIRVGNIIWSFDEKGKTYFMNNTNIQLFYVEKITKRLNDEVEIIEENKKIEKLVFNKDQDGDILVNGVSLIEKVNEIIDKVNKEK